MTISSATWQQILDDTDQLKKEHLIKGLIPSEELVAYRKLLMDSLSTFLDKGQLHLGLKVYIEQELQSGIGEQLRNNIPTIDTDPEAWGKEVFDGKRFGIILNNLEKYSGGLSHKMAQNAAGLMAKVGMPLNGLALLFFMGNYGFTPFGIHKENYGEEGFLIHFGPGAKTFYTWKTEEYLELSGGAQTFAATPELMAKATPYVMEPGDAFFVPSNIYHVAETNEFSFSMVLDYLNASRSLLRRKLISSFEFDALDPVKTSPITFPPDLDSEYTKIADQLSIDDELKQSFKRYCNRLVSNGGFEERTSYAPNIKVIDAPVTGLAPYKIILELIDEGKYRVTARGHEANFMLKPSAELLADQLNVQKVVTLSVEQMMAYGDEGLQFMMYLANVGALHPLSK